MASAAFGLPVQEAPQEVCRRFALLDVEARIARAVSDRLVWLQNSVATSVKSSTSPDAESHAPTF
jgi:hypothetical protein